MMRNTGGQVFKSDAEKRSFYGRADHSDLEAMQSLMLEGLRQRAGLDELPCEIRTFKQALQSDAYADMNPYEKIVAKYEDIGLYAGFKGSIDAVRARVRRMVDEALAFNAACDCVAWGIEKGGKILRDERGRPVYNDLGEIVRTSTTVVDYLKAEADAALTRAKARAKAGGKQWRRVRTDYMGAECKDAISRLPEWKQEPEGTHDSDSDGGLPTDEYIKRGKKALLTRAENFAKEIDRRGFDYLNVLEEIENDIKRLRDSLKKTAPARNDNFALERVKSDQNLSFSEQNEGGWVTQTLPTLPTEINEISETVSDAVTLRDTDYSQPNTETYNPPCVSTCIEGYAKADLTPIGQARLHVETFRELGATELWFGFKDDSALEIVDEGKIRIEDFIKDLPALLDQSERNKLSLIIRPFTENITFIQLDETLYETLSCLVIETSEDNYQSWIAVSDCGNYEALRRAMIKKTNADKGASGACRLAGTRNFKPHRNEFQIRLTKAENSRVTTKEIETAFNFSLRDEIEIKNEDKQTNANGGKVWNGYSFPQWSKTKGATDSEKEASFLATCKAWGIPSDIAWREMEQQRPRKKQRRKDYKRRTLNFVYG